MCGISGGYWISNSKELIPAINESLDSMHNRGPDSRGYETFNNYGCVVLGHTRLSIIDLSEAGHQPMTSPDKNFSVVFNGEIYNYKEIKKELELDHSISFYTETDTEVLLAAWQVWGESCLKRFKGMFAFAMYDKTEKNLTLVRDAFGIKPLFYKACSGEIIFGSTPKALSKLSSIEFEIDPQQSYNYLVHGCYDQSNRTFYKGMKQLPPAHILNFSLESGIVDISQWWKPSIKLRSSISFDSAADKLRSMFLDNVRLHLRSDVPLGVALSGGVDSSAIVCAMRMLEPEAEIHTFSFIADNNNISEESWVDKINDYVNAVPHKVHLREDDLLRDLEDMIEAQHEPFGSTSIYAQYCVYREAKKQGITVMLDGQGADEMLAGYSGYPGQRLRSLIEERGLIKALTFLSDWAKWPGRSTANATQLFLSEVISGRIYQIARKLSGRKTMPAWLNAKFVQNNDVCAEYPTQPVMYDMKTRRVMGELAQRLTGRGLSSLLRHADRNSMRFSVESRVPFLTIELVEFLLSLPEEYLISSNGETKSLFRKAMRGIVPDEVLDRKDKIGFATPEYDWLIKNKALYANWLTKESSHFVFDNNQLSDSFDKKMRSSTNYSSLIWRWINYSRWISTHNFDSNQDEHSS